MKYYFLFLNILFFTHHVTDCSTPPIYVTVHTHQNQSNQAITTSTTENDNHSAISFLERYNHLKKPILEYCTHKFGGIVAHLQSHKIFYITIVSTCTLATIIGMIHFIKQFLHDTRTWHQWSGGYTKEELYTLSHEELAHQLLYAIQKRYFNEDAPANTILPLVQFFKDIEKEAKNIRRFMLFIKGIQKIKLHLLLSVPSLEQLEAALHHLSFLEHLCKAWCCNYNMRQLQE